MSFLAPRLLWTLALLIPIAIAFIVKNRKRALVVPSTLLWRRAATTRLKSRRFRWWLRLLALAACLAAVASLALAAARPQRGRSFETVAIVVDVSASMDAGGPDTPMRRARRFVARMLASRGAGDRYAIIAAGASPERLAGPTDDAVALDEAAGRLVAQRTSSDLGAAIDLASALVARQPGPRVIVLHDGGEHVGDTWHPVAGVDVSERRFEPGSRDNLGVSAFASRAALDPGAVGDRDALVTIASSSEKPRTARMVLLGDGREIATRRIEVPPNGAADVEVPLHVSIARLEVRVTPDDGVADALALDDAVTLLQNERTPPRALLVGAADEDPGAFFVERALRAGGASAVVRVPADFGGTMPGPGDVVVALAAGPTRPFEAPALYVGTESGVIPVGSPRALEATAGQTGLRSASSRDPLLRGVTLDGVAIDRAHAVDPPAGARSLVELDGGPVVVAGPRGRGSWIYVGIDPVASDLVLKVAFPVLIANALAAIAGDSEIAIGPAIPRSEVTLRAAGQEALAAERMLTTAESAVTEPPPASIVVRPEVAPEPRWRIPISPAILLAALAAVLLALEGWAWQKGWST